MPTSSPPTISRSATRCSTDLRRHFDEGEIVELATGWRSASASAGSARRGHDRGTARRLPGQERAADAVAQRGGAGAIGGARAVPSVRAAPSMSRDATVETATTGALDKLEPAGTRCALAFPFHFRHGPALEESRRGVRMGRRQRSANVKDMRHGSVRACVSRASGSGPGPGRCAGGNRHQDRRGRSGQGRQDRDVGPARPRLSHREEPQGALCDARDRRARRRRRRAGAPDRDQRRRHPLHDRPRRRA